MSKDAPDLPEGSPDPDNSDPDREPIHSPGRIQSHGALLAVAPESLRILYASSNAAAFLEDSTSAAGVPARREVLGRRLDELFPAPHVRQLAEATQSGPVRFANPLRLQLADQAGRHLTCIAHRSEELLVLEFEPDEASRAEELTAHAVDPYFELVHGLLRKIEDCGTVAQMSEIVARHARAFTGFDRVMVYRFHPDGHGEVVGESTEDERESFLGLHFPASDIPEHVRQQYKRNLVRLIVDVDAPTYAVAAAEDPGPHARLDLSDAALGEVPEPHLQYLRNMGIRASMSVSLLHRNELWGLLIFHHDSPRFVPFSVRGACELLGAVVAPRLAWQELEFERLRGQENRKSVEEAMQKLVLEHFAEEAIDRALLVLCRLFDAGGACLRRDGVDYLYGRVPDAGVRDRLLDAVYDEGEARVFSTERLTEFATNQHERAVLGELAGALAVLAYEDVGLIFFREPTSQAVRWAGDPTSPVTEGRRSSPHQPRESFKEYIEEQRSRPKPWSKRDLALARELRSMLMSTTVYELDAMEDRLEARMKELTGRAMRRGRLHALVEVAEISIWEFDVPSGRITDQHWSRVLGYEQGELEPTLDGFRMVTHPDDADRVINAFQRFLASDEHRFDEGFRLICKDGSVLPVHSRGRVTHRDPKGEPLRVLGVHYPLDGVRVVDEDMQQRSEELESLIYAISHDLKSPLVTCQGFVGLARQGLDTGDFDGVRNDLERIEGAAQKMGRIIDDLLAMSRIGRVAFLKEPLDLTALFREVSDGLAQRAFDQGVVVEIQDRAPLVVGDRASLCRAVENLLSNALKYGCPDGGKIEIGAERDGDEVRIYVRDDGPGIDPRYHERIFELFARLSTDEGGTGVGLASVAKVAQVHGGHAWVSSALGEGATFWIGIHAPPDPEVPSQDASEPS